MRPFARLFAPLLAVALLGACGHPAVNLQHVPSHEAAWEALASEPIKVAFNDTYGERTSLNEPKARKNPRNTDKDFFRLVKLAKTSIDGAFYDIGDEGAVDALIDAKERGVKIRLVTDTDNMAEKDDPSKPRAVIGKLKRAGIAIVDDQRSGIMHHKFMIVDGKTTWMGSTNLTTTSLYNHNNNALTFRSAPLSRAFTHEFERLFIKREFGMATRGSVTSSVKVKVGKTEVEVFFSPRGGGREAVVEELKQAKKSVSFLTFSLTDPETGATLVEKAKAGVKVEGVFDRWLAAGEYSLFKPLQSAGIKVYRDGNQALMHHKVIVIDNKTVITGSYNYSQNAEVNNNEAFVIIRGATQVAGAYAGEFRRVLKAAKTNRPPPHKEPDPEHKTGTGP